MKIFVHKIERDPDVFHAHLIGSKRVWGIGWTIEEAVFRLITANPDRIGLIIECESETTGSHLQETSS